MIANVCNRLRRAAGEMEAWQVTVCLLLTILALALATIYNVQLVQAIGYPVAPTIQSGEVK